MGDIENLRLPSTYDITRVPPLQSHLTVPPKGSFAYSPIDRQGLNSPMHTSSATVWTWWGLQLSLQQPQPKHCCDTCAQFSYSPLKCVYFIHACVCVCKTPGDIKIREA